MESTGQSKKVFSNLTDLVEHCKEKGILLFKVESQAYPAFTGGADTDPETREKIHELWKAVEAPENVWGASDGILQKDSGLWVTEEVLSEIAAKYIDESSDIRRLFAQPLTRSFVYFDVSDFSMHPPGQQVLLIRSLISVATQQDHWSITGIGKQDIEAMLCIGDGYIFVFRDPGLATYFAGYLARLVEMAVALKMVPVKFHFRIGVHVGPVYCFWDPGRKDWNYIGEGINEGKRVLEAIGKDVDDVVFISGELREELDKYFRQGGRGQSILPHLQNRGRRKDKHEQLRRVYELNHTALCGRDIEHALASYQQFSEIRQALKEAKEKAKEK
jgi:class 3 adenylate cyclase